MNSKEYDRDPWLKATADACPLCHGKVVYRGFHSLECATFGCENAGQVATDEDFGTYDWALRQTEPVEYYVPAWDLWCPCEPTRFPQYRNKVWQLHKAS